ncbi:MAG: hypothetical protein K0R69_83 [Clostridia bacterium]|jgi:hypothetical protein|nr:hypothetical protein [Clostridia bacterium]
MKKDIMFLLKNLIVYMTTILVFGVASKMINGSGNMPQFMIDAYETSIFIKTNTKTLAIVSLCSVIVVFLLISFHFIKDGIHNNRIIRGLIYGGSFGIVWFFGFTEMIIINHSDKIFYHLRSGVRDLLCLSLFGLTAGLLLCKNDNGKITRKPSSLLSVIFIGVFFAFFHGIQYYFTFESISAYQRVSHFTDVLWLLAFGAWIGFMYYILSPGIKLKNRYLGALFFSYFIFGTDWLLFNLFYNVFLDIPLWDLFLRCFAGCTGVFIGLVTHEYILSRKSSILLKDIKTDA